jgi:polyisoprenoid-binding protein YceI
MKSLKSILAIALILTASHLFGQTNYVLNKDYKLTINGGSNLHDWTENVEKAAANASVTWNSNGTFTLNGLTVVVYVQSIKSSEGGVMNGKTYKALKSDSYPTITFTLTAPLQVSQGGTTVVATGNLNIAGVTRGVTIHAKVNSTANNNITIEGAVPLRMSEFGIDPPNALFGALKVSNNVTIQFKTNLIKS